MELDVFEIFLGHREDVARIGEEDITALLILRHILVLALLEVLKLCVIIALDPTGLIEMNGLPTALRVVLVLQTILDNLELQLTHRTDDLTVVELVDKELRHTFVHQLIDTLLKLFGLHGVVVLDVFEELWREGGQASEMELFALGEGIANLKDTTGIRQTYDIAWPCLIDGRLTLCHELRGRGETHGLALTHMQIWLVALELTAAHLAEGDTGTVVGVDIRGDLEDEARELLLLGFHLALFSLRRTRRRGYLHETVQKLLHTEVIEGRAKEHGGHLCRAIGLHIKLRIHAIDEFEVLTEFGGILLTYPLVELLAVNIHLHLIGDALFIGRKEVEFLFVDVIHALELRTLVDRPR